MPREQLDLTGLRVLDGGLATELERAGCIKYKHGVIEVVDRAVLEREACECYAPTRRVSS